MAVHVEKEKQFTHFKVQVLQHQFRCKGSSRKYGRKGEEFTLAAAPRSMFL